MNPALWLTGGSRSGKTQRLVDLASQWLPMLDQQQLLLLAANDESKQDLNLRLSVAIQGRYPVRVQTPLGFLQDQVYLFYPLICPSLNLPIALPIRLRPETEQALATQLWQAELSMRSWQQLGVNEYRLVRRLLDLMQLAANAGIDSAAIPEHLQLGYGENELFPWMGELIDGWRQWCLECSLLTYGLTSELFWRYLWPHPDYQKYFSNRYGGLIADDADDYPAIIQPVLAQFIQSPQPAAISYNPHGQIRLGLSSDPAYLGELSQQCQMEQLAASIPALQLPTHNNLVDAVVDTVQDPSTWLELPSSFQQITQRTRGEMLRAVVMTIAMAIDRQQIAAHEIAIIAPGLDNIARYTLTDAFAQQQIPVVLLNNQRPLNSSPSIRAILTLVTLIMPGLGRLTNRDEVAEMLVELSRYPSFDGVALAIDPVRAGLIVDYCYSPAPDQPHLLPIQNFPRWDRLGAQATASYEQLLAWIKEQQTATSLPLQLFAQAIATFFGRGNLLAADQLSILRELLETAQHYWLVAERVDHSITDQVLMAQFILLLRQGTVSANPYPAVPLAPSRQGVTLTNIFQYRSSKQCHRWHFWLDIGSPLWAKGGTAALYGAPLFLQNWDRQPLTIADEELADSQRLERVLRDLLCRVSSDADDHRLFLCHSDLAVNGQEQVGALLTLHSRVTSSPDPYLRNTMDRDFS
jgi:hypothetical protein